jgi:hypothetical protein
MKQGKLLSVLKSILILLIFIIPVLILNSCSENPDEFTMGEDYLESQANLRLVDTFTVNLSTVILDTVETAATGSALVGIYSDNRVGKINCSSYFRMDIPSSYDAAKGDVFDSLALVLEYSKYSFGDTTQYQKISVHQLTENISVKSDSYLSNHSTFSYNPSPLGTITYKPRPNGEKDTITIKLNNATGQELLNKLIAGSETITDTSLFTNYFHGLMIEADQAYPGCVVGFNASKGDIRMILYSHRTKNNEIEDITNEFTYSATDKQFNNIQHDFSSTSLSSLTQQKFRLPSSSTNGMSFLQGGIGLAIRVDFPSLSSLLLFERGKIADAKLLIAPETGTYKGDYDLPDQLVLYKTDKVNRRNGLVTTSGGSTVFSTRSVDNLYHENSYFQFDLTNYITTQLANSYVDPDNGLLITLYTNNEASSLYRLIADAGNKNTKLKIYYLSY